MAAFISSTWQGTSTRIPGTRIKLTEQMSEEVIRQVLPKASALTQKEVNAFLEGESDSLSFLTSVELKALVIGHVRRSGAGR